MLIWYITVNWRRNLFFRFCIRSVSISVKTHFKIPVKYPTYQVLNGRQVIAYITLILPRSRTGTVWSTLLPATRDQHDQNCTQSH